MEELLQLSQDVPMATNICGLCTMELLLTLPAFKQFLDSYPDQWIGKNRLILWPSGLSDRTPADFYLWDPPECMLHSETVNMQSKLNIRLNWL